MRTISHKIASNNIKQTLKSVKIIKKLKKWKDYSSLYEWIYEINLINK